MSLGVGVKFGHVCSNLVRGTIRPKLLSVCDIIHFAADSALSALARFRWELDKFGGGQALSSNCSCLAPKNCVHYFPLQSRAIFFLFNSGLSWIGYLGPKHHTYTNESDEKIGEGFWDILLIVRNQPKLKLPRNRCRAASSMVHSRRMFFANQT